MKNIDLIINTGHVDRVVKELGQAETNLDPILNVALDRDWKEIHGKNCKDILDHLCRGYVFMLHNKSALIDQNKDNDSTDYYAVREYLHNLIESCVEHPKCKIDIS